VYRYGQVAPISPYCHTARHTHRVTNHAHRTLYSEL
jgi:hypothetical protein